jgi:hypothetical protein
MPTIIFVGSALLVTAMLVASLNGLVGASERNRAPYNPRTPGEIADAAANSLMNVWLPSSISANGTELAGDNAWQVEEFTYSGQTDIGMLIARNWSSWMFSRTYNSDSHYLEGLPGDTTLTGSLNSWDRANPGQRPADFVFFWQSWQYSLFFRHVRYALVTFDDIIGDYGITGKNLTIESFQLRAYTESYFAYSRDIELGDYALWSNDFDIGVSTGLNATLTSVNPWSLIGQLMGFKLPNTPPIIQYLIAVPFWLGIAVVIIELLIIAFKPSG